jgi:HlyD family secretion protein
MISPQPVTALERPRDGAMDRRLARRRFTWPRAAGAVALLALAATLAHQLVQTSGVRSFAVAAELLTVSTVRSGAFLDFIPIRGSVRPLATVYLDSIEGGRVEAAFMEEGGFVRQGDPILELSNTALQLDVISREAQVSEQLNNLRNTRLAMEQNRLALESALVEIDYQVTRLTRLAERRAELVERNLVSRQDYDDVLDELEYYRRRRAVTLVQDTGGHWAFVLDSSGTFAEKRHLRLGRRNPEYFEVLEGLANGERVITSAYTSYAGMDRIVLRE